MYVGTLCARGAWRLSATPAIQPWDILTTTRVSTLPWPPGPPTAAAAAAAAAAVYEWTSVITLLSTFWRENSTTSWNSILIIFAVLKRRAISGL